MTETAQETILIQLTGQTPAVLTGTLWGLAHEEEPVFPDRIVALTTSQGATKMRHVFFEEGGWAQFREALEAKGFEIEGKLRFGPVGDAIRVCPSQDRQRELEDVRSADDAEALADYCMETLRGFTESDQTRIIVSIAGGRKASSALLHSVMTLMARNGDRITHVLVPSAWERQRAYLFPGCPGDFWDEEGNPMDSAQVEVTLMDVPFVPMRYFFKDELHRSAGSFTRLMREVRSKVENIDSALELRVYPKLGEIEINNTRLKLAPMEFLFYLYFAQRAMKDEPALPSYQDIDTAILERLYRKYKQDQSPHWTVSLDLTKIDLGIDPRKAISKVKGQFKKHGLEGWQIEKLIPGRPRFSIDLPNDMVEIVDEVGA